MKLLKSRIVTEHLLSLASDGRFAAKNYVTLAKPGDDLSRTQHLDGYIENCLEQIECVEGILGLTNSLIQQACNKWDLSISYKNEYTEGPVRLVFFLSEHGTPATTTFRSFYCLEAWLRNNGWDELDRKYAD